MKEVPNIKKRTVKKLFWNGKIARCSRLKQFSTNYFSTSLRQLLKTKQQQTNISVHYQRLQLESIQLSQRAVVTKISQKNLVVDTFNL